MVSRAEIAGVIWDKDYVEEHPAKTLYHITGDFRDSPPTPLPSMIKYVNLLEKYAADVLIFRINHSSLGYATKLYQAAPAVDSSDNTYVIPPIVNDIYPGYDEEKILGYGAVAIGNENAWLWAHEVGHVHGLEHCHGVRRTFDIYGNYTESSAVSGFHTLMEYAEWSSGGGYSGGCFEGGDITFPTTLVTKFSNPNLTYNHYHPFLGHDSTYSLGTNDNNSSHFHDTSFSRITALHPVPHDLVITGDMALESYDYANFVATNSVTIESGFRVNLGAKLKISVGSHLLAKRSIVHNHSLPPPEIQADFPLASSFSAQYNPASKSVQISVEIPINAEISVMLFDIKGTRRAKFEGFHVSTGKFSKTFPLHSLPNGTYFIRAQVGSQRFQQMIVKW